MARGRRKTSSRHRSAAFNLLLIIAILVIIGIIVFGFYQSWFDSFLRPTEKPAPVVSGELSIHFLELGNKYNGDCIYIKAGDTDILVDGGSRTNSVNTIANYVNDYCTDGVLEYVIITHADQDHIAAWAGDNTNKSLFELYECEVIIDFPRTNKDTQVYNRYVEQRDKEIEAGATHYNALQCYNNEDGASRTYQLSEGVELQFLYQKYYEIKTSNENDYSVCFLLNQGSRHFLFTGDLEENGEQSLVESNDLPEVDLFKAGHHGSQTATTEILLSVIKPDIVCVTCNAGSTEYSDTNTFPNQQTIDRIAPYTDKVYVTSLCIDYDKGEYTSFNGNIRIISSANSEIQVDCSANNTLLKDSQWFLNNRQMPQSWANAT